MIRNCFFIYFLAQYYFNIINAQICLMLWYPIRNHLYIQFIFWWMQKHKQQHLWSDFIRNIYGMFEGANNISSWQMQASVGIKYPTTIAIDMKCSNEIPITRSFSNILLSDALNSKFQRLSFMSFVHTFLKGVSCSYLRSFAQ